MNIRKFQRGSKQEYSLQASELTAGVKSLPFDSLNPELETPGIGGSGTAGKPWVDMLSWTASLQLAQLQGQRRSNRNLSAAE